MLFFDRFQVHGFWEPYVTLPRSRYSAEVMGPSCKTAGFIVLDSFLAHLRDLGFAYTRAFQVTNAENENLELYEIQKT